MGTSQHPTSDTTPPDRAAGRLGLPQATALIVGSIIGVGIFNLPSSLASFGPISLVAMALTTVGALALALLFASLSRRLPADGGPYAYARAAFGNATGFANAWSYWITAWSGNAAIVVGWVMYVQVFVNAGAIPAWSIVIALLGLWIPALINITGVKNMGAVQLWTSVLKFIPLALMATLGLLFIRPQNLAAWNVSGESDMSAILGAMALCLFSYLGVETASVAAAKVRDPDRNVPRATVLGTIATAVVYLLSLTAVFGAVPTDQLAQTTTPYSVAADTMTGGSQWAGYALAVIVIVSGFGALNGWTMICAEMPLAASKDGLFPERFGRLNAAGVPVFGIVASTLLASVFMIVSYLGTAGQTVFNTLVFMSGITAAIPYAFSALAQLKWRIADNRRMHTPRFARDLAVAVVALVFSILFIVYSRNDGGGGPLQEYAPFLMAGAAFLLGVPVYLSRRGRMSSPEPVPEFR